MCKLRAQIAHFAHLPSKAVQSSGLSVQASEKTVQASERTVQASERTVQSTGLSVQASEWAAHAVQDVGNWLEPNVPK